MNFFKALGARLRNYGFLVSVFAFIPIFCNQFGIPLLPEKYESYKTIFYAALSVLVAAGLVNDPTTQNKGYRDDPKG